MCILNNTLNKGTIVGTRDRIYDAYFKSIGKHDIMPSALTEQLLFYRYRELGDLRARTSLVHGNLRYVVKVASQYSHGNSDLLNTYIAAGNVGLLKAIDKYCQWVIPCHVCNTDNYVHRRTRQVCKECSTRLRKINAKRFSIKFLTYAHWWITEAIRAEMYSAQPVYMPSNKQKEYIRDTKSGKSKPLVYISLDDENNNTAFEKVLQSTPASFDEKILLSSTVSMLYTFIQATLSPRQAYVIITYYGLRSEHKNLREISATLGICAERVRQIKEQGLRKLKRALITKGIKHVSDTL